MKKRRLSQHIVCGIFALVCPVVAFSATLIYQWFAYSDFWNSLPQDNESTTHAAGAMMGFAEVVQIIFFTAIGCLVGVVFAGISIWLWFKQRASHKLMPDE